MKIDKAEMSLVASNSSEVLGSTRTALAPLQRAIRSHNQLFIFFCGNPARGDDSAGYLLYETLKSTHNQLIKNNKLNIIYDHQWQIEDALELKREGLFLFVDASARPGPPICLSAITTAQNIASTSHSLSPSQLLGVAAQVGIEPPEVLWQLGITGYCFELGAQMSPEVKLSCTFLIQVLDELIEDWSAQWVP
ncbi:hypothetical protein [Motiliproteus sp. MSK22-1]|uniref:hypothetical protein n=1 Tax=Motiliproteus sp. MSK22-1 TaxID=1897630 RepID=UPI00097839F7|nr:hypothetical protein [Motiliproteus sp. MSK22-1]OMH32716.1 hypothetical protein BGP75_14380 [Motiliproteus sp. MSK22-1]